MPRGKSDTDRRAQILPANVNYVDAANLKPATLGQSLLSHLVFQAARGSPTESSQAGIIDTCRRNKPNLKHHIAALQEKLSGRSTYLCTRIKSIDVVEFKDRFAAHVHIAPPIFSCLKFKVSPPFPCQRVHFRPETLDE